MTSHIIGIVLFIVGCTNRDTTADKSTLLGGDYRLFQNTSAWELAKAVEDGDADKIKADVSKNKGLLNFRDPRFGQSLLQMAVQNKTFNSVKTLVELGADPNMQDNDDGTSPLMEAANVGVGGFNGVKPMGADPRFLQLLLKYGGDPNAVQKGPHKHGFTPLLIACMAGNLDYVKMLVNAGGNVNYISEYNQSPLAEAIIAVQSPDIVLYLIEKGADFRRPIAKTIDGEIKYITNGLREWRFDLGSDEYKKKMQIVDFLKKNGMDYRKTEIPKEFLDQYSKKYLAKY